jgi:hypothetical protein
MSAASKEPYQMDDQSDQSDQSNLYVVAFYPLRAFPAILSLKNQQKQRG